jgi:hypothetical protein
MTLHFPNIAGTKNMRSVQIKGASYGPVQLTIRRLESGTKAQSKALVKQTLPKLMSSKGIWTVPLPPLGDKTGLGFEFKVAGKNQALVVDYIQFQPAQ